MISGSKLCSEAGGLDLSFRESDLEGLCLEGALKPVALQVEPKRSFGDDFTSHDQIYRFADADLGPWSQHRMQISKRTAKPEPRYSPWQLLYCDQVFESGNPRVDFSLLAGDGGAREKFIELIGPFVELVAKRRSEVHASWEPLIKTLVCIQAAYYPMITGIVSLIAVPDEEPRWPEETAYAPPQAAEYLDLLGISLEGVASWYWFLTDRGFDVEPNDGLEVLRRALTPSRRAQMEGTPARAQLNFDAAQMLGLLYSEATGVPISAASTYKLDGRQNRRALVYRRGPSMAPTRAQLISDLKDLGLYPHSVHVIGEGASEERFVKTMIAGLLGSKAAGEIGFTDLGGVGNGSRLETMISGFSGYAHSVFVLVDKEGKMREWVEGIIRSGLLSSSQVLFADKNLEEDNFTVEEILEAIANLAGNSSPDGSMTLRIPAQVALQEIAHAARGKERQGAASVLLRLAESSKYGPAFRTSKPALAEALAEYAFDELAEVADSVGDSWSNSEHLVRPAVRFVVQQIVPVLEGGRWRGVTADERVARYRGEESDS
jgi:hypothetical protein